MSDGPKPHGICKDEREERGKEGNKRCVGEEPARLGEPTHDMTQVEPRRT